MSDITVTLACGCQMGVDRAGEAPLCVTHNERRVAKTKAPAPRFIARDCAAKGPCVTDGR